MPRVRRALTRTLTDDELTVIRLATNHYGASQDEICRAAGLRGVEPGRSLSNYLAGRGEAIVTLDAIVIAAAPRYRPKGSQWSYIVWDDDSTNPFLKPRHEGAFSGL